MTEPVGLAVDEPRRARRGPAPGATREEVLELAREHWLACRRIDVQGIAAERGVGRATVYRWFGSREGLIAEAMMGVFEARVAEARAFVGGRGAVALLDTIELIYRGLAAAPHIRFFIGSERETALRVLTSSQGQVHPRIVALIEGMIETEVESGGYRPPSDPDMLAYVLVRLAEALLFSYEEDEQARNVESLRSVLRGLLGA